MKKFRMPEYVVGIWGEEDWQKLYDLSFDRIFRIKSIRSPLWATATVEILEIFLSGIATASQVIFGGWAYQDINKFE